MNKRLSQNMYDKLFEVIKRRNPRLLNLPLFIPQEPLTDVEREAIREVLADEFCEFGLKADSEPNKYGIFIDDLIGKLDDF